MQKSILVLAAMSGAIGLTGQSIRAQEPPAVAAAQGPTHEGALYLGVIEAPPEIGRDLNAAGGDTLVARLGSAAVTGAHLERRNTVVGVAASAFVWFKSIGVRNTAGVDFPHHGKPPALLAVEVRLYPFGQSRFGGRVVPYVSAGAGGLLVSVDLDNVDDQELRLLWQRSVGAGVKIPLGTDGVFLDLRVTRGFVSARGPLSAFDTHAVIVGVGSRFE